MVMERYQSMCHKFEDVLTLSFLFKKKVPGNGGRRCHSGGRDGDDYKPDVYHARRPPARQRVLKIKDHRIDETSLAVIMDRRVRATQVGRCFLRCSPVILSLIVSVILSLILSVILSLILRVICNLILCLILSVILGLIYSPILSVCTSVLSSVLSPVSSSF